MKKLTPVERNWTPRRRGSIYCAPACGGDCTYAAYLKACKDGDRLAARCGPGYTRSVHENLGWFFCAESPCKRIRVHQYSRGQFSAWLENGSIAGQFIGYGTTPSKAISKAVELAAAKIDSIRALLKGLV